MLEWLFGRSFHPDADIPSLAGKIVLVTGGNNGLGKETVLQLAKHSPKEIFLAARTESKAVAAIADINAAVKDASVTFLKLDLSSFRSIKQAADDFSSRSDRLDILINNAGIAGVPYSRTEDGYEIQFGTNHMGHALLTKLLLPVLLKTADKPNADLRVINVSSKGHMFSPAPGIIYDQAALEQHPPLTRYGHSKLANILHARELQKRYPAITATAVHPGVIITDIYNTYSEGNLIMRYLTPIAKAVAPYGILPDVYDVPGGTLTQLWAAIASREKVRSSHYWLPIGVKNAGTAYAQSEELAKQLWEWTEAEFSKHST
ncbi:hypothetical protein LTR53_004013 [Teratosphaeriaceae sp. CCFEE 6253]|nr:hypothetical protein LTR53_004013 [Teratosphaeriaceae sp. CCFEE 6253]